MNIAFLFPGEVGDLPTIKPETVAGSPWIQSMVEIAAGAVGANLPRLLLRQDRALVRGELLQPALTAVSLGICSELMHHGVVPSFLAGHAVGELSAWTAAGSLGAEAALQLAALRGHLTAREARKQPSGMLLLSSSTAVRPALRLGRRRGEVFVAAHNSPTDWVLAGSLPALRAIAEALPARLLSANGPWQSPLMRPALAEWREAVCAMRFARPKTRVVCSHTARASEVGLEPGELVAAHLTQPVRWARTLSKLARLGVTDVVTMGPGRTLRDLTRQNAGDRLRVHRTEEPGDLEKVAALLARRPVSACRGTASAPAPRTALGHSRG